MAAEHAKDISKTQKKAYKGVERAAILLFSLPEEQAQKVFSSLEDYEVKDLTAAMVSLGSVGSAVVEQICVEFVSEMAGSGSLVGSIDSTKRLLSKIMSKQEADNILEEVRGPSGKSLWEKLAGVDEELVAGYLKNESPQTVAVVLSRVSPATAAKVLACLPESMGDDVVTRILRMDKVRKEIIDDIEMTLHKEFISTLGKSVKQDPFELVAEVFNNLERSAEERLMGALEKKNPSAAERVRQLMFTFEDLENLDKISIQKILKNIDKSVLAMALKGTHDRIKQKFTDNMSERASKLLLDDMAVLGLVKLKDVQAAQNKILARAKDLAALNEISLHNDADSKDQLIE